MATRRIMSSRAIGFGSMPVDSGTYFIVVTPWSPPVQRKSCSPRTGSIAFLLHCLLKGIQEWIGATRPIWLHRSLFPVSLRAAVPRPGAKPRPGSRYPFVNCLQQGMKQTCDFHLDSSSIHQGDMHSIDGRNGSRLFTTSAGDQPRKIADAREPPGPPLGGSHLKPAI